ncbi:MAG: hypothetical protein MRK02_13660 [Candidatus Scalindua sp.]|nr:hypothetical protein [Candidatus Scalindua sp.]
MKRYFSHLVFCRIICFFGAGRVKATVILELSFDQVCQGSELIFEGQVVSREIRPSPIDGKPFTYVTFQIIEVIKGTYTGSTVELGFMGGQINGLTLKVSGMHMPAMRERGIYFVENLSTQQIHPLCGWQQGHCLVICDRQTGQDMVIPVEDKNALNTNTLRLTHAPALEVFKQSIRNVIEKDK